jgi:hypothetical protein
MIFSLTTQEKRRRRHNIIKKGITRFAWRPVKLEAGNWIWWEKYISLFKNENIYELQRISWFNWYLEIIFNCNNYSQADELVKKLKG